MRLLLDTHIFLWSLLEPERLSRRVATALEDPGNELWLSPIVIWEVLILAEKGRVVLEPDAVAWVRRALQTIPFREAPLTHEVAIQSRFVALPHQDPADRFLAATALVYDLTLVTADERLLRAPSIPILADR
ncbi:MAG: ribonuclease VapC [Candidatus Tectimicrobiota bacterium]|nr:MAG: ribonuclease VapC [Candidatus Tectomicrobia bacterium]